MLNRVILMGRLVADPELKTTGSGNSVTSFRIAVDRSYVKSGEERKADFIDIVCWRHTAEFVCRYFSKGSLIALEGQLQTRTYEAKDGTNRYVVEVVADTVSFTGERKEGASSAPSQNAYQPQQQNGYQPPAQPQQNGYQPPAQPQQNGYQPPAQPQQNGYQPSAQPQQQYGQPSAQPQPPQRNQPAPQSYGYNTVPQGQDDYVLDDDLPF